MLTVDGSYDPVQTKELLGTLGQIKDFLRSRRNTLTAKLEFHLLGVLPILPRDFSEFSTEMFPRPPYEKDALLHSLLLRQGQVIQSQELLIAIEESHNLNAKCNNERIICYPICVCRINATSSGS
jgi:hypothetical protein